MITIISASNRINNRTRIIAQYYMDVLKSKQIDCQLLDFVDLKLEYLDNSSYSPDSMHPRLIDIQDQYIIGADKWIIISPEYNGSFSGIFKLFIDIISTRNYESNFKGKKICLTGVSSGRAGNLRGLDHLTNNFNYLKSSIFYNKLPISLVNAMVETGELTDEGAKEAIESQIDGFIAY